MQKLITKNLLSQRANAHNPFTNAVLNVLTSIVQPHLVFAFRDTNRDTLVFLSPETRDHGVAMATRVSGRK